MVGEDCGLCGERCDIFLLGGSRAKKMGEWDCYLKSVRMRMRG